MGRARVGVTAAASVMLILASALALDWFYARVNANVIGGDAVVKSMVENSVFKIDLHSIGLCHQGVCVSVSMSKLVGAYPTLAGAAFWVSLVLAGVVAFQAGVRMIGGAPNPQLNTLGYVLAFASFVTAALAGYMFGPETGNHTEAGFAATRSWGAVALLVGDVVAVVALYFAVKPDEPGSEAPVIDRPRVSSAAAPAGAPTPARSKVPDSIPLDDRPIKVEARPAPLVEDAGPTVAPAALRGVLKYATATATLASIGIDATLEAGTTRIVRWSEVVGIHARRLPPSTPFDSVTFIDLVSTAGATLRILPWTRLAGDSIEAGEGQMRAVVNLVAARCPGANVDRATRAFADGTEPARQLPDEATLAAHDEHLA